MSNCFTIDKKDDVCLCAPLCLGAKLRLKGCVSPTYSMSKICEFQCHAVIVQVKMIIILLFEYILTCRCHCAKMLQCCRPTS